MIIPATVYDLHSAGTVVLLKVPIFKSFVRNTIIQNIMHKIRPVILFHERPSQSFKKSTKVG